MLKKTKGIVIGYLKYRDSSIIVQVFTRELGLKSYVVNSVRSAKAKSKMALYQPLTLLDLVVYDKENRNIHRISEARLDHTFTRLPFEFHRSGIALFIVETLNRSIAEHYQNEALFDFLYELICHLDREQANLGIFPLAFLVQLTSYLGFEPEDAEQFYEQLPINRAGSNHQAKSELLTMLINQGLHGEKSFPSSLKRELMDDLLVFYQIHLENFGEVKSLPVLRSLM
ncbi:MAG: DNA repair protein RecO [Lunatimonas sp.]|uniref:DNA repair protein RecO n=1 Tax=Lunatimonas sp. TaxID=2060141 RepID=UPI00263BA443|nr:DNA repair protein RecO [Lunatimonas sp.]MCC5936034.1 DNA repair protein RecO [Lunatimonas sp.]